MDNKGHHNRIVSAGDFSGINIGAGVDDPNYNPDVAESLNSTMSWGSQEFHGTSEDITIPSSEQNPQSESVEKTNTAPHPRFMPPLPPQYGEVITRSSSEEVSPDTNPLPESIIEGAMAAHGNPDKHSIEQINSWAEATATEDPARLVDGYAELTDIFQGKTAA